MEIDFTTITACGECCVGCKKKEVGLCKGCIESDGHCEEWAQSGGCPIHKCSREHGVQFCGLCTEFPCEWIKEKIVWNPYAIEHLAQLVDLYKMGGMGHMEWTKNYKKAITFSYDDGVESDLRLLEILNKYNLKATFNVNTGLDEKSKSWVYKEFEVKRLNLARNMEAYKGHEIAVHTLTHPNLCEISEKDLEQELLGDRENIQKLFNQNPIGMAYPYGAYSEQVIEKLRDFGFLYARGVQSSHNFDVQSELLAFQPTCHHDDEKLFELAERFLSMETEQPQIFYIWGHSYEFEGNHNWDRMEEFCKLISGKKDIFYGTNREVLI